ncbi:cyclin-U1-1 [Canna indica]|uniref:Cyclin-U1-1 n=1 Tax=Canna indica TaxID=4628 RepID=A0AAQ3QNU6_9LILI|nr:cyclin-U1-1 [Canna indica]
MEAVAAGGDPDDPEAAARVLEGLTFTLERMVARNERLQTTPPGEEEEEDEEEGESALMEAERRRRRGLAFFKGTRAPGISVGKYLERLRQYTGCSAACFVVGFVYIDRAAHRHPGSLVLSLNVHRLVLTSLLIASKILDDSHHDNAFFAKVGGVSNAELNRMELELLFMLDFRLVVTSRVFESYCWHLEKEKTMARVNPEKGIGVGVRDASKLNGKVERLPNGASLRPSSSSPRLSMDF